jgi:2-isopropylmalate synthase
MGCVNETARVDAPICVIDATLREGCQSPGVVFDDRASADIAALLVALGVDAVECGHPAISETERLRIRAVRKVLNRTPLLCHARATLSDVRAAAEVGADWVGIFIGISPLSLAARHNLTRKQALRQITETTQEAVRLGMKVRFTVEDTSRTEPADAAEGFAAALAAGASRICFADTVGALSPQETRVRIGEMAASFPGAEIEAHLHDDRGLALANALAALEAGARWISASVNGLGERCGIVDLAVLLANLAISQSRTIARPEMLQVASARVAAYARAPVDARRPVVGSNAFTHTSRLHQRAVKRYPRAYEWIDPSRLGRVRSLAADPLDRTPRALVTVPPVISATELRHHRHGPGQRYVMIDERFVHDCRQYCIVRRVPRLDDYGAGHVDRHTHCCDSLFLFMGNAEDLTGLMVEVSLEEETFPIQSPAAVFIPAGVEHSYRIVGGAGIFVNHVLAGSYDASLLDSLPFAEAD